MTAEPRIQYARTSDEVSIAYYSIGTGPPLVVTPYAFSSHLQLEWEFPPLREPLESLASGCRLIRYDRRGTGLSERLPQLTVESEQMDLCAVVDASGERSVNLMSRGFGTPSAVRFAISNPNSVSRLILYDPIVSTNVFDDVDRYVAQTAVIRSLLDRDYESMLRHLPSIAGSKHQDWWVNYFMSAAEPDHMRATIDFRDDVGDLVGEITQPTLVIYEQAPSQRAVSTEIASRIPDAEVQIIRLSESEPDGDMQDVASRVLPFLGVEQPVAKRGGPTAGAPAFRTILFTDLVGHTEMMSRLGDERGREVLREHERITREVLAEHGGTEVKTLGDGFMASFGSVTKAVECAVALQRAMEERNAKNETRDTEMRVRIGLNAGEPIEEDGDLFGATVILASRIAAKAEGGEILVADTVRGLCSGKGFLFSDRGDFVAKGFEEPVRVYEVGWGK